MTAAAEPLRGLDVARLEPYLDQALPTPPAGPLEAELIAGGRSNLTYRVTDGQSRWVLRRPPLGHVLPTAHDMRREFTVIAALAGTAVPVPQPLALCTDEEVLGAPFYLMAEVDGVVLRSDPDYAAVPPGAGARIGAALVDVLTELHAIDPAAVGLADFGKPDGYLARQLRTWARQWEASRTRELPGVDVVLEQLSAATPTARRAAIVHGDYRLDNVIIDSTYDRVLAVLDWEMATLGDPMTDVGMLFVYTDLAARGLSLVTPTPDLEIGLPSAQEMVDRYGKDVDVDGLEWYIALGYLKLAIIAEGINARYLQGKTVGAGFDRMGAAVPMLIDLALGTLADA